MFPLSKFLLVALSLCHFVLLFIASLCVSLCVLSCSARESHSPFAVLLLFDLITNLVSLSCARGMQTFTYSSVKSCRRSLSKYSASKLKQSVQTECTPASQLNSALWEKCKQNFIIESAKVKQEDSARNSFASSLEKGRLKFVQMNAERRQRTEKREQRTERTESKGSEKSVQSMVFI